MIPECWALIATYSDERTALLLSQRCGTIQIKHTYIEDYHTITTINGVKSYKVWSNGVHMWYKKGHIHREDGPAIIYPNGVQMWFKNDELHREDPVGPPSGYGPAIIHSNGDQEWYKEDKRHREDGPAIIWSDGHQMWYKDGELHREDGPAAIYPDGHQEWYKHGIKSLIKK